MSFSLSPPPKLGARLQSIVNLLDTGQGAEAYDCIWDCCCDHGYLGLQILTQKLCPKLVFVDQQSHIMEGLSLKLEEFPNGSYEALTQDASTLQLDPKQKHLLIVAGVGGEHGVDIVRAILANNTADVDIIFCPANAPYILREYLNQQEFTLLYENIVTEKNRDYEIIYLRAKKELNMDRVSLTGDMWTANNRQHHRYLNKLVRHYQNRTFNDKSAAANRVFKLYEQRLLELS